MTDIFSDKETDGRVQALIVANATVDESYAVSNLPLAGESLIGDLRCRDVGGKGANVATMMARCGVSVQLIAGIGDDDRGSFVRSSLAEESMRLTLLPYANCATDVSLIYTDPQGENSIVTTVAATQRVDSSQCQDALAALRPPAYLVLQGNLCEVTTQQLMEEANRQNLTVVLNPSPCSDWMKALLPQADIVFLNEGEALSLTGLQHEAAIHALLNLGLDQVVLTCGSRGALLGTKNSQQEPPIIVIDHCAAVHTEVVDTTGAGDTYLSIALASAILRNHLIDVVALNKASTAAAITVSRFGTRNAFPDANTLRRIIS